ncbi:MAG: DnaJ domain-containing protein, partial [Pyrinomonadaceae bacterium]|nr:DnaJ domain-containing protein [Pyrinomonadaceae bacterium]
MSEAERSKDYYAILGAQEDATRGEIDRLYRRKAVQHHPDRGGSEEEMKTLNEAYRVLKDETTRRAYDVERQAEQAAPFPYEDLNPPSYASPGAKLDAITHQLGAASLFLFLGLVLLFIVRFQYVIFLWPLALTVMAAMYCVAGFGTTIGFHRLLTHRAFETYRPIRLALAICG